MAEQYYYYDGKNGTNTRHPALARIELLANWMDARWEIPGTGFRVGLDAILGLIPGIGDTITTAIGAYIIYEAHRLGAPNHIKLRMVANLALDGVLGSVPLVGDVFDASYRANLRNAELLRKHLQNL